MNVNGIPATPEHVKAFYECVKQDAQYALGGQRAISEISVIRVRTAAPFGPYDQSLLNPKVVAQFTLPRAKVLSASRSSAVTLHPWEVENQIKLHTIRNFRTNKGIIELFVSPIVVLPQTSNPGVWILRLHFSDSKRIVDIQPSEHAF